MHRTTIPLEAPVESELRRLAAQERRSFKELVNDLLRRGLQAYRSVSKPKHPFEWHTAKGEPVSGFDVSDRSTYMDVISKRVR